MARPIDMPPMARFAHGVRARYTSGCRCDECKTANRLYEHQRTKAIIFHGGNPLVPSEAARAHLRFLSRKGVGRRAVAAASDVSETVIQDIRAGRKKTIRRSTEKRLLDVTTQAVSDHSLISAASTWRMIRELLDEGFTKAELARRLGYKSPALQMRNERILARNAARVERFYNMIMLESEEPCGIPLSA